MNACGWFVAATGALVIGAVALVAPPVHPVCPDGQTVVRVRDHLWYCKGTR